MLRNYILNQKPQLLSSPTGASEIYFKGGKRLKKKLFCLL